MTPLITLTTDFGPSSHYVAQMKGVLASALPNARVVDVTHIIPPGDIGYAEVILRSTAWAFPLGTVHIVVVDPGVGTQRRGLAVATRGLYFVGPDNGVLSAFTRQPDAEVVTLDQPHLFREPVAPTFHGRDVFAPVAAELAGGLALSDVGTRIDDAVPTTLPTPSITDTRITGQTLAADHFGNLFTNIPARLLSGGRWSVRVADQEAQRVRTYGDAEPNTLIALAGSDGYLEIAMPMGSAARRFSGGSGLTVLCDKQ